MSNPSNDVPLINPITLNFNWFIAPRHYICGAKITLLSLKSLYMNFQLSEEHEMIREAARSFAQQELLPGVIAPVVRPDGSPREPGEIDMMIVRENTEGEYSSIGGRMYAGTPREIVMQETVMSRYGVDRVLRFAFELAQKRGAKHLTSATKSNGIAITMPYWDERFAAMAAEFPDIRTDQFHIDILCAHFVQRPDRFDVVVASNLFGDILSDLGPACTGTIGLAPSGNLNPERKFPSLFEPVHGSAPDIAGQNIANPIGQIWAGAMMLDFLGYRDAHDAILEAVTASLQPGTDAPRTRDLGGTASTQAVGEAIAKLLAP